jgi:hypothetical protein
MPVTALPSTDPYFVLRTSGLLAATAGVTIDATNATRQRITTTVGSLNERHLPLLNLDMPLLLVRACYD